jgi:endonuclease/exonuclease/phosphatase family metal-dependent hydrolase
VRINMKLITLNIWGGQIKEPLLAFILAHQEVDFLCFQEVNHRAPYKTSTDDNPVCLDILDQIAEQLPHHRFFFRPVVNNVYGLAMFVRKDIELLNEGEVIIHENPDYPGKGPVHQRNLQWMQCRLQEKEFMIVNTHFLWNGAGKNDSPERIQQSHKVKNFLDSVNIPKIICGDFNLRPDTESMKILEDKMTNLIKDYNIQSTRTSLYPKSERFADYVLVSNEIIVNDFKVLPEEVSDHAALKLEFSLK